MMIFVAVERSAEKKVYYGKHNLTVGRIRLGRPTDLDLEASNEGHLPLRVCAALERLSVLLLMEYFALLCVFFND